MATVLCSITIFPARRSFIYRSTSFCVMCISRSKGGGVMGAICYHKWRDVIAKSAMVLLVKVSTYCFYKLTRAIKRCLIASLVSTVTRRGGSSEPYCSLKAFTISRFVARPTLSSKNARVTNCSPKYHMWRPNAADVAFVKY